MKHVLFVCNHNAGRSQMAEAFFNARAPEGVRAESAGSNPASELWPDVVAVMAERGIDVAGRIPKKLTLDMQLRADWAVTMGCGDACPSVPTVVEDWSIPDPAGRPIDEVRRIRDLVEQQVNALLTTRLAEIRGDHTVEQQWLRQLLPALTREFGDVQPAIDIRRTAETVLSRYADVRVRSFVVTLAHREAREALRGGRGSASTA